MAAGRLSKTPTSRPVLEWMMGGVGCLATLAVVAVVAWEAVQPAEPPALSARIVRVEATSAGHVAKVEVRNDGRDTAAAVDVEARLGAKTATATIAYVPGHGYAYAFVRFDRDPRSATVTVKGWSAP